MYDAKLAFIGLKSEKRKRGKKGQQYDFVTGSSSHGLGRVVTLVPEVYQYFVCICCTNVSRQESFSL